MGRGVGRVQLDRPFQRRSVLVPVREEVLEVAARGLRRVRLGLRQVPLLRGDECEQVAEHRAIRQADLRRRRQDSRGVVQPPRGQVVARDLLEALRLHGEIAEGLGRTGRAGRTGRTGQVRFRAQERLQRAGLRSLG